MTFNNIVVFMAFKFRRLRKGKYNEHTFIMQYYS